MKQSDLIDAVNKLAELVKQDVKAEKVKSVRERYINFLDEAQDPVCDSNNGYAYLSTTKALGYAKELAKKHGFFIESVVTGVSDGGAIRTCLLDRVGGDLIATSGSFSLTQHLDPRKVGAEITCFRRYQLMLILGVVSRTEDDEGVLDGKKPMFVSNKVETKTTTLPYVVKAQEPPTVTVNEDSSKTVTIEVVLSKENNSIAKEAPKKERKSKKSTIEIVSQEDVKEVEAELVKDAPFIPQAPLEIQIPQPEQASVVQQEQAKEVGYEPIFNAPEEPTLADLKEVFNKVKEKNLLHKLSDAQVVRIEELVSNARIVSTHEIGNPYRFLKQTILGE